MKRYLYFSITARSDVGFVRDNNEDNLLIEDELIQKGGKAHYCYDKRLEKDSLVCAVCDGMGGHQSGEIASYEAVRQLKDATENGLSELNLENRIRKISNYISDVNSFIYNMNFCNSSGKGMGTTIACLLSCDGEAVAIHVGDSRVYHFRKGVLKQLTTDHSENERLIRLGILSPEQARNHKSRFILYRHLGMPPSAGLMEPDVSERIMLQPGDVFLLCSDGLTDMVEPDQLQNVMASDRNIIKKADDLLKKALNNGGKDNISVILVEVTETTEPHPLDFKALMQKPSVKWSIYWVCLTILGFIGYQVGYLFAQFMR